MIETHRRKRGGTIRLLGPVVACLALLSPGIGRAAPATQPAEILQDLKNFRVVGSVLMIAAHPDDENTQLITYLARGRGYRMAYLSLTRGDGGQNLLGPEFGDELGVIRTQELLAARRIDSGQQFFSRARDFGYSKDYRQTLTKWDRQQVDCDIVRVIRQFRPDVVVTRFSTLPGNTHGHHTASAILAVEAYKMADDPNAFADQLKGLAPWKPKRILYNGFGAGFRPAGQLVPGASAARPSAVRIDISGNDPVLGVSFGELAARSRSMHKTQGFGNFAGGPIGTGAGPRYESFQLLEGEAATKDILDGVDTTWNRFDSSGQIDSLTGEAIAAFNSADPSASVPALLAIRARVMALPSDPVVDEKRAQLDRVIQSCLGLEVQTTIASAEVVPGEQMALTHTATVHSNIPVQWVAVQYPAASAALSDVITLQAGEPATRSASEKLPLGTPLSQPYWLRADETPGMFRVDDASLIDRPENPPVFPVDEVFEVGGQRLTILDQPLQASDHRRLDAIPPVTLSFASDVQLFARNATREVQVKVTAYRPDSSGTLHLDAPDGWKVAPPSQAFHLGAVGDSAQFAFTITAPSDPTTAGITARADINGATFDNQRIEIHYSHIPPLLLLPPARVKAVCLDLSIRGTKVGYLPGAGDSVADCLTQMGYTVTTLTGADLTAQRLHDFDAVVIGVRAFNVRADLPPALPALLEYVRGGGTVVAQYNTPNGLLTTHLGPYDLALGRDLPHNRVTDETAPVTLLVPDHPAFNSPNRITPADFDGWVQERGLNFPQTWDTAHYTALLACSDAGEAPLQSGVLVAHYGDGYFVYTGISWFRQLPAGVPGAYRLFANLVSLGK
jgi:LmbE family N-acetylglucosaminyl deacetylase